MFLLPLSSLVLIGAIVLDVAFCSGRKLWYCKQHIFPLTKPNPLTWLSGAFYLHPDLGGKQYAFMSFEEPQDLPGKCSVQVMKKQCYFS